MEIEAIYQAAKTPIAVALLCLITSCSNNPSNFSSHQELIQVVRSLQQIDSATSVGTNIGNYTTLIASAKTDVDIYLTKDKNSESAKKINRILNNHLVAVDWWQCNLSQAESSLKDKYEVASECRDTVLPKIFELSPSIQKEAESAIAAKPMRHKSDSLGKEAMLQLIWQETSRDTKLLLAINKSGD